MRRRGKFIKKHKPSLIWYRGNDPDYGQLYCSVRTEMTPHLILSWRKGHGYVGWDCDRHRFHVTPAKAYRRPAKPHRRRWLAVGWRKEVYGPRTPWRIWKKR